MSLVRNIFLIRLSPFCIGALFILFFLKPKNVWSINNVNQNIFRFHYPVSIDHKISSLPYFPDPLRKILRQYHNRYVAAALAFPFPFGCVGLHRVYLGTAAHVPIVYAATAGGVFGLIPLIDCLVLLSHKDISEYTQNNNIIMWIKHTSNATENTSLTKE